MAEIIKKDESILTEKEKSTLNRLIEKLEQFYPEHKAYAMDSLCSQQRETAAKYAKKLGYATVAEFLLAYGYELIKGSEVYEIRKDCGIKPGEEPDFIKERIDNAIRSLNEYYPDHIIKGSIQREHKSLGSNLGGFWQWLGYKSMEDMLAAYGFNSEQVKGGRPSTVDPNTIVAELKKRYPEGTAMKASEIKLANPDLKIKSVMNKAQELFGMSFADYLVEQGIILAPKKKTAEEIEEEMTALNAESLKEYDGLIQRYYLKWKPLPGTSEELINTIDNAAIRRRIRKVMESLGVDPDEHFSGLSVIAADDTDNELRELIQYITFEKIIEDVGLRIPTAVEAEYISEIEVKASSPEEKSLPSADTERVSDKPQNIQNWDKANSDRTSAASNDQVRWIMSIIESELGREVSPEDSDVELGLRSLQPQLKEVAILRLRNPEANLTEIGQMLSSPVGKAGVYKRLEKIHEIAIGIDKNNL